MTNNEDVQGILQGMFAGADLSGAQIIAYNNGEVNYNRFDGEKPRTGHQEKPSVPTELTTRKATMIRSALFEAGIVDDGFMVCDGSLSKQAIVAEEVSKKLFIGEDIHWALFEQIWGVKNLRSVKKTLNKEFRQEVKACLVVATQNRKM